MKTRNPAIKLFDQRSILIEFEDEIGEDLLNELLTKRIQILENHTKVKLEVIHSYDSLLIIYPFTIKDFYSENQRLKELLNETKVENFHKVRKFAIPVCYDSRFAPDLSLISKEKKLAKEKVIDLHTAAIYRVHLVGFLPGFLYLGGLNKRLEIQRKDRPRPKIEAGSVGIGGSQTGIYPRESPGGWQVIGRCPLSFFDPSCDPPMQINPGDQVEFYSISLKEFLEIKTENPDLSTFITR